MSNFNKDNVLYDLQERVKELTTLHLTAKFLNDESIDTEEVMEKIVSILPNGWQYPDITAAVISFDGQTFSTSNFIRTDWKQIAPFTTKNNKNGFIEIYYLEEKPHIFEGPFLKEERSLINSLVKMLKSYFERKIAEEELKKAYDNLEQIVINRTSELISVNKALCDEILERKKVEEKIEHYQKQLRQLTSELSIAEEKERRSIASDLHDHIGQALAIIKMRLLEFQGNAIFCGFEKNIVEIRKLLEQTIQYTRNLTFEISPPVLYELGLVPAIEWLGEEAQKKHKFNVNVLINGNSSNLSDEAQIILFKAVRELLLNAAKHSNAAFVTININWFKDKLEIVVEDNGCGFDTSEIKTSLTGFGLFSIRERLRYLGGKIDIISNGERGTKVTISLFLDLSKGGK